MQFQLPGTPLFPATTDGMLLKPTLRWQIDSRLADHFTAELAYITGGLSWDATYNVVAPDSSDVTGDEKADVLGWVTIHNQSGTEFPQAQNQADGGRCCEDTGRNRDITRWRSCEWKPRQWTRCSRGLRKRHLTTSIYTISTAQSLCAMEKPSRCSLSMLRM